MVPSSARITSGEPAFAQEIAHSLLMGLSRPFVKAHAESRTYPLTVTLGASAAFSKTDAGSRTTKTTFAKNPIDFMSSPPARFDNATELLESARVTPNFGGAL